MSDILDLFRKIEEKRNANAPISFIIAGLGNPGDKYKSTRHNIGFIAVDYIADKVWTKIDKVKFHSLVGEINIGPLRGLLMKPETFMNNSGQAIAEAAKFYKIPPERIIVLHDEISFDPGIFRIRRKGSSGGHNGLKSIIACLGSEEFPRIKIGVGQKPSPDYDLADFVLGKFPLDDLSKIIARFNDLYHATELILSGRIDEAMNRYSK